MPFGGENEHYNTAEDARSAYEKSQTKDGTLHRSRVVDGYKDNPKYVDTVGGTSESKAVKEFPPSGSFDKAVSAIVQYRDEDGNFQNIEFIAQIDRLSDKRRIELGRQMWAFTGKDPQRFEDASDAIKLRWANQRIMRRSNYQWTRPFYHETCRGLKNGYLPRES